MSSGCAHPVDHCMCAHRVDHWMCAPSGPLDVCICITTTCKHPRAHRKPYIRWSTRCSYIWWTTSSPLVVIRMQRHLVDHRMCKSPVYVFRWNASHARVFSASWYLYAKLGPKNRQRDVFCVQHNKHKNKNKNEIADCWLQGAHH